MATLLLVRHGQTPAEVEGVLAGWTPGVHLDRLGRTQVKALAERMSGLVLDGLVTSPLERCRETAEALAAGLSPAPQIASDLDLADCRYGSWTGRSLADLAEEPLWPIVQNYPSAVTFPGGESVAAMQARALTSVRRWNKRFGGSGVYAAVTHGDVIKVLVADAMGMHLDMFQRIVVAPASVTVIRYTPTRPFLLRLNATGEPLRDVAESSRLLGLQESAEVGGGSGH